MKKLLIIALLFLATFSMAACDNTPAPVANPVDLPTLLGDEDVTLEVGTPYDERGLKDITEGITITGTVDVDTVGDYEISYTLIDDDGIERSITRTVHIVDTTLPQMSTIGGNLSLEIGDTYSDEGAKAIDNYDGDISDSITVVNTVDVNTVGTYTITYSATDSSGNTASITRTVTVSEALNNAPVIVLTGDANISLYVNETFTDPGATASDIEDGTLTSAIVVAGTVDVSTPGTYTITYNVVDSKSLAATTVSRTVLVLRDEVPVITLIGDATITLVQGESYSELGASASDTEDGSLTDAILVTGTVNTSLVGTYTISYNVSDSYGNQAVTVTRTVLVTEDSVPVITLIGDPTISILIDDVYTDAGATATDTEDGNLRSSIVTSGAVDTSVAGIYTISYDVTDSFGNAAITVTRTVTVRTNTIPVITLTGNLIMSIEEGENFIDPGYSASDAEDGVLTSSVTFVSNIDNMVVGNYSVVYSLTDSDGNTVAITRTVTVKAATDNMPVIHVEGDNSYTLEANDPFIQPSATAWDFEDGDLTDSITVVNDVDMTKVGVYHIVYTVVDSDLNTVDKTIEVNVVSYSTPPVITVNEMDQRYQLVTSEFIPYEFTAYSELDGDLTSSVIVDYSMIDMDTVGLYTITYTVTDNEGLTTVVTKDLNVVNELDTPPVITLVGGAVTIKQNRSFIDPGYTCWDDQDGDCSDWVFFDVNDLDITTPGVYTVQYYLDDLDGNHAEVLRSVTVVAYTNTDPVITLNGDAEITIPQGTFYIEEGANATDFDDGDITSNITIIGTVDTSDIGTYLLLYSVFDEDGVEVTVERTITVVMNYAPVITLIGDETVFINVFDDYVDLGATAFDKEDGDISSVIRIDKSDLDTSIPGTYIVQYQVTDTLGKSGFYYRTVVVENNLKHIYGTVVIDLELDVDFDELFTRLDIEKPVDFSLDLGREGQEFMVFGDYGVLFIVSKLSFNGAEVTPDALIYTDGNNEYGTSAILHVYHEAELTITKDFVGVGGISINQAFYDEVLSTFSLSNSSIDGYVGLGTYVLSAYSETNLDLVVYSVTTKSEGIPAVIPTPLNDFVYVSDNNAIRTFEFTANGGPLQLNIYGPNHYLITIYDSENNVVLSRYDAGLYKMTQNFAAGDYKIVIERLAPEEKIIVYISSVIQENYGLIDAETIDPSIPVTIDLIPGFPWYQFEVTEAGYYTFNEFSMESSSVYGAFYTASYASQALELSFYLEAGTNYLKLEGYGSYTFSVTKDQVMPATLNNTIDTASPLLDLNQDLYSYFDGDTTHKWYSFDIIEDVVIKVHHEIEQYARNTSFTIYYSNGEIFDYGSTSEFIERKIPVGSYYLEITGNSGAGVTTTLETEELLVYSADEDTPTPITGDTVIEGMSLSGTDTYFEITIDNSGYYLFYYDGFFTSMEIEGDQYGLYSYVPAVLYLEAGTHEMRLNSAINDYLYEIIIKASDVNTVDSNPYYLGDGINVEGRYSKCYVQDDEVHVFDRILVRETAIYYIQPMNAYYAIVYDPNGEIIDQGKTYELENLLLTPGVYTIEYISEEEGFMYSGYEHMESLEDYSRTMTNITIIDKFTDLQGYFGKETMDTVQMTIPHDMLLEFSTKDLVRVVVLDENKDFVTSIGYTFAETNIAYLEAGNYYLIINSLDSAYYNLYLTDRTERMVSNDILEATTIYLGNDSIQFINKEKQLDAFFTFTIETENVLNIDVISGQEFEILDSDGLVYTLPYFIPGDYILKVYSVEHYVDQAFLPSNIILEFSSITSKIITNDSSSAVLLPSNTYYNARRPLPGNESWFTFTSNPNEMIQIYRSTDEGITLYDDQFNEVSWPKDATQLPLGNYYIKVIDDETAHNAYYRSYTINLNKIKYVDAATMCSDAILYNIPEGSNHIFTGFILSDTDVDCYKIYIGDEAYIDYFIYNTHYNYERVDVDSNLITTITSSINEVIRGEEYIYIKVTGGYVGSYTLVVSNWGDQLVPDNFEDAKEIELGVSTIGYRETSSEDDYYKFTLEEENIVFSNYFPSSAFTLFDSDKVEIENYENAIPAGEYYLVFNNNKSGSYSFTFYEMEEEEKEEEEEALPGYNTYEEPIVITDRFFTLYSPETDGYYTTDYYQLILDEDTLYKLEGNNSTARILIYDEEGVELERITDWWAGSYNTYLEAGTYKIYVTYSYNYNIEFEELEFIDYSNDIYNPDEVFMYETVHSYIFGVSDIDFLTLTLDEETIIEFNQLYEIKIRVYNDQGELLIDTHAWPYMARLEAGTYSIHVTSILDEVREYEWYISELDPDYTATTIEDAVTITIDEEFTTGTFYQESETGAVYVKLQIDEFTVLAESQGLYLCDMDENYIFDYRLQPGMYLLKLVGYRHFFSIRDITEYYFTNNENPTPIQIGQGIHIKKLEEGDFAEFEFTPSRDKLVYFDQVWDYFHYDIVDSQGTLIYGGGIDISNYNSTYFLFEADERYEIHISDYSTDLNLRFVEYLFTDYPDTKEEAYTLTVGEEVSTELFNRNDEDWFTFTTAAATTLYLSGVNYTVYYPDDTSVFYNAGEAPTLSLDAGTYYVEVKYATSFPYTIMIETD